jgi:hypothetical protein
MPVRNEDQDQYASVYAIANSAMIEITELGKYAEPLWIHSPDSSIEVLNEAEYIKSFSGIPLIWPRVPGLTNYEDSRATDVVMLNCRSIMEIMMNPVSQFSVLPLVSFCFLSGIVSWSILNLICVL